MLTRAFACCVVTLVALSGSPAMSDDDREAAVSAEQARLQHEQQVLQQLEELRTTLEQLHTAYRAELKTIRDTAAADGDQDEVRRVEELLTEDPVVARVEPRRWLWKSGNGFFERLSEGHWIEKIPNGDPKLFSESTRTPDYVELSHPTTIVRLYDNRCMVRFPARERGFRKFYDGAWFVDRTTE